jgi:hypothetical protein
MSLEYTLPEDRVPEAEVSLRLAFHLLSLPGAQGSAQVAVDGAMVQVDDAEVFPISGFLAAQGWKLIAQEGKNDWQGTYEREGQQLVIHAKAGVGDVVARVGDKRIRAECKGGPLIKKPGSREYPILRGALGQVLTVEQLDANDVLVVAVPYTQKFHQLANKWREAPLVTRTGIEIVLVGRDGAVEGLEP